MTAITTARRRVIGVIAAKLAPSATWSWGDMARAAAWMAIGIAARAPLVARIEGALDHDQSVVGLMALDIAAGRRWPVFFDGQRYMGAVEAYTAAAFVALFGHSPTVVALAPLLFFGFFAAGQYALWRCGSGRATGHLAALVAVLGSPMLALWSIVPRGGYIELLAWATSVLAIYRAVTRPEAPRLPPGRQAAWGFLLGFGYFLNPLSLIVYLTLAVDWTLGRHGAELRRERGLGGGWIDARGAPAAWVAASGAFLVALALCCHVKFCGGEETSPFVFLGDTLPRPWGAALGTLGIVALVGGAVRWSGAGVRALRLAEHTWFAVGAAVALMPMVVHNVLVKLKVLPWKPSLPIWIRAPWEIGPNLRDGARALGPLVGCDPGAPASVLLGQGVAAPVAAWPGLARGLGWASPAVVAAVAALVAAVAWRDRRAWQRFWRLHGDAPTPPTVLALIGLGIVSLLYLLQATSPNASSIRYLLPVWIVLPGLVASGIRALPAPGRAVATGLLLASWAAAQVNLWADLGRPCPARPLARELERRGNAGIVAQTPVALIVANLTAGRVGAFEYRPLWPRLRDRYAGRFDEGRPVACVVDRDFPWSLGGAFGWSPRQDMGLAVREVAARHPGRARHAWSVGRFEVWEVDRPLVEVDDDGARLLPSGPGSAKVLGDAPTPSR